MASCEYLNWRGRPSWVKYLSMSWTGVLVGCLAFRVSCMMEFSCCFGEGVQGRSMKAECGKSCEAGTVLVCFCNFERSASSHDFRYRSRPEIVGYGIIVGFMSDPD